MDRLAIIIALLLESHNYITISSIADKLKVSSRTIRYDLTTIEQLCQKIGLNLCKKAGVGIAIEGAEEKKSGLMLLVKNSNKMIEPYSTKDRVHYILEKLLMGKTKILIADLAHGLYVSRATIHKDLSRVATWLETFHLSLLKKPHYGIEVVGNEENCRNAIASLMCLMKEQDRTKNEQIHAQKYKQVKRIDETSFKKLNELIAMDYLLLEDILTRSEAKMKFKFSEESYISLVIHIAISIKRIQEGKDICLEENILTQLFGKKEYAIADEMAREIETSFQVKLPKSEVGYILLHILGAKKQKHNEKPLEIDVVGKEGDDLATVMAKEIIQISGKALELDLSKDITLLNGLILHLRPTINRLRYGLTLRNPIIEDIKTNYPHIYGVAWMSSVVFDKYLNTQIKDEEIGYIALHIGGSVERNKDILKVLVVCHSGIGTSQFLSARLERVFRQIQVTDIVSTIDCTDTKLQEVDFVISTVHIETEVPVLEISPLLTQHDIKKLDAFIEGVLQHKKTDSLPIIDRSLMFIEQPKSILDKEQSIKHMCYELYRKGYVTSEFYDDVIKREKLSSTFIGKGLIIPHGLPDYVNRSAFAVTVFEEPLVCENEEIYMILIIGIAKKDLGISRGIFRKLYKIMDQGEDVFKCYIRSMETKEKIKLFLEGL